MYVYCGVSSYRQAASWTCLLRKPAGRAQGGRTRIMIASQVRKDKDTRLSPSELSRLLGAPSTQGLTSFL